MCPSLSPYTKAKRRIDQTRVGRVSPGCADEVSSAFEVDLPDLRGILRAKNGRKVNDGGHTFHGFDERCRIEDVAFDSRHARRKRLARPHQRTAFDTCVNKARQQTRTH